MVFPSYHTTSDVERDLSPSPYPPSTPSLDSDSEDERPNPVSGSLRATLAALPEHRLRDIVLRLAGSNSDFRRALQKEVSRVEEPETPPTTPTRVSHRRHPKRAKKTRKSRGSEGKGTAPMHTPSVADASPTPEEEGHDQLVYHPGHLEDEVYEFVSRTPNGAAFKVVQTVTMWSCCNEDEWSPGCILITPAFDRDAGKLAPLDMRSLSWKDVDVYPDDSDLESPYSSDLLTPVSPVRRQSIA